MQLFTFIIVYISFRDVHYITLKLCYHLLDHILQIQGTLVASHHIKDWKDNERTHWILFNNIQGLNIQGGGIINGNGRRWWKRSCKIDKSRVGSFSCSIFFQCLKTHDWFVIVASNSVCTTFFILQPCRHAPTVCSTSSFGGSIYS